MYRRSLVAPALRRVLSARRCQQSTTGRDVSAVVNGLGPEDLAQVVQGLDDSTRRSLGLACAAQEAGRCPKEEFSQADTNADGVISPDEWREWAQRLYGTTLGLPQLEAKPTKRQLRLLLLHSTVPFIGFGFCDNAILILAGDFIDASISVTLGFSMMMSAGLGNLVSDVIGLGLGGMLDDAAEKLGLPTHGLTPNQRETKEAWWMIKLGMVIGTAVGCLLGLLPLAFMDPDAKRFRVLFDELDSNGDGVLTAEELQQALMRSGLAVDATALDKFVMEHNSPKTKVDGVEFTTFRKALKELGRPGKTNAGK